VIDAARLEGVNTHEFRRLVAPGSLCSGSSLPRAATRLRVLARSGKDLSAEPCDPHMQTTEFNPTKATVLVVEDSFELQNYLRFLLELDRYQVEIAGNGEEALQRLHNGCSPRVVLLDMQMPGMDGLETLRILRQLHPAAKVIMCSGVDDPDKIRQALALGAQAYLVKPVKHLYLSAAIERCLEQDADEDHEPLATPMATRPAQQLSRPN
jgi:CheY-like chemotaxis protein